MKKTLLLATLLIGLLASAQNYDYIAKSKTLASEELAVQFAKETAGKELHFFKAKDFGTLNKLKVVFAPKDETDTAGYLYFTFAIDYDGQNKALEIPGVKQYRLIEVESKYLTIFPIWQSYFKATATLEKTVDDYKSQRLNEPDKNIRYLFQNQNERWLIIHQ